MREVLRNVPGIDVEDHMRLLRQGPARAAASGAPAGSESATPAVPAAQPPMAELEEDYGPVGMRPQPPGSEQNP
eukprot:15456257-Alexandrium_andersonii.AAC.1